MIHPEMRAHHRQQNTALFPPRLRSTGGPTCIRQQEEQLFAAAPRPRRPPPPHHGEVLAMRPMRQPPPEAHLPPGAPAFTMEPMRQQLVDPCSLTHPRWHPAPSRPPSSRPVARSLQQGRRRNSGQRIGRWCPLMHGAPGRRQYLLCEPLVEWPEMGPRRDSLPRLPPPPPALSVRWRPRRHTRCRPHGP